MTGSTSTSATPDPAEAAAGVTGTHLGIAEQGKIFALAGQHDEALRHYREAMRRVVTADPGTGASSDVFLRHYTGCALESLERMGAYAAAIEYCRRAVAHYAEHPPTHPLARLDLASYHEREGVLLLKSKGSAAARSSLEMAVALVAKDQATMPLAATLLRWIVSGLHVDARRVEREQERCAYFVVRAATVRPDRAVLLPNTCALTTPLGNAHEGDSHAVRR